MAVETHPNVACFKLGIHLSCLFPGGCSNLHDGYIIVWNLLVIYPRCQQCRVISSSQHLCSCSPSRQFIAQKKLLDVIAWIRTPFCPWSKSSLLKIHKHLFVGGFNHLEKMSSSMGRMTSHIYILWKIKAMFQTTNQICLLLDSSAVETERCLCLPK